MTMDEAMTTQQAAPRNPIDKRHLTRVSIVRLFTIVGFFWVANRFFPDSDYFSGEGLVFFGGLFVLALTAIVTILLTRLDRPRIGLALSIITLNIVIASIGVVFNGLGILLALILLLTIGSLSAADPHTSSWRRLTIAIVVGLSLVLLDILLGAQPWRFDLLATPSVVQYGWIVTAFLFIANIVFFYRQFLAFPLRIKLAIVFLVMTITSLWMLSFINNRTTQALLTEAAQTQLFATANQVRLSLDNFISVNRANVNNESSLPAFSAYLTTPPSGRPNSQPENQAQRTLNALTSRDPLILSYALVDPDGMIVLSSDPGEVGQNISRESYFTNAFVNINGHVSEVHAYTFDDARLYFSDLIRTGNQTVGVLLLTYDAGVLQRILETVNTDMEEGNFGVLFDRHLIHLAHSSEPAANFRTVMPLTDAEYRQFVEDHVVPDAPVEEINLDLPELEENLLIGQGQLTAHYFEATDIATGERINQVVTIHLDSNDWLLAFFQPQDIFLAPAEFQLRANTLISILLTLVVVFVGVNLSQILTTPISELNAAASQLSAGNLDARANVFYDDEIGELAITFNSMAQQLGTLVTSLEQEVSARTAELGLRSERLQTAAEIARDATIEKDLDVLVTRAANLMTERLNLYFAGIYILDQSRTFARLVAGSGDEGRLLVSSDHRANLGVSTPLSYAMTTGEARLIRDGDSTLNLMRHPVLPNLVEQLVLPLNAGNELLGVIDLQSDVLNRLSEDDIPTLSIMADQLAIAIQKNSLTAEMEQTLEELETAYGRYTRESWQSFISEKSVSGYRFSQFNIEPLSSTDPSVREAWLTGEIVELGGGENGRLLVPVQVRGQVVGVLNLGYQREALTTETRNLIAEIATRLGLVMENARLVETAQRRVEREQISGEISARMRETLDMDAILRTSVEEIAHSLGLPEIEIRLGKGSPDFAANGKPQSNGANGSQPADDSMSEAHDE